MNDFWNQRYAEPEYAYGISPNSFFAEELKQLSAGKILLPAEGEGRNAVFAAKQGWQVFAFDSSEAGKIKAMDLAIKEDVIINYEIAGFENYQPKNKLFDCIGLIFVHMPRETRMLFHKRIIEWLKPGGKLILQAFSKEQITENSGGPKSIDMLYSIEELQADFRGLAKLDIRYHDEILDEGKYHQGKAKLINLIAFK